MKTLSFTLSLLLAATFSVMGQAKKYAKLNTLSCQVSRPSKEVATKKANPLYSLRSERASMKPIADVDKAEKNAVATEASVTITEVRAFPNPFETQIDVFVTDHAMNKSSYKAELFDVHGKKVHSEELFLNQTSLQLSHLSKGVYFLYIEKNGKMIRQEKFVKQ